MQHSALFSVQVCASEKPAMTNQSLQHSVQATGKEGNQTHEMKIENIYNIKNFLLNSLERLQAHLENEPNSACSELMK